MTSPAPDRLAVIVPTRGRPENVRKVLAAWDFTGAWADADLILAVDRDDPELQGYMEIERERQRSSLYLAVQGGWTPMVPKLNWVALAAAKQGSYAAIAFAGDDHLPRTIGWARRYLDVLAELGTGMVYGDDGYQGVKLATEWAVTADAVRALGRKVPAPVDHLYCDNAMMDLYGGAGAMRHLPEVRIEHMHPVAGKAQTDAQYDRVNSREQYAGDRLKYVDWKTGTLWDQVAVIRGLRAGRPDEKPVRVREPRERDMSIGSEPRKVPAYGSQAAQARQGKQVQRSGPRASRQRAERPEVTRYPWPHHFKAITGATPPDIELTLADLAAQVPADQEIVELGVYQARTAIIMAWGAAQGNGAHVTAVDAWDLPGNTYDPPFTLPETRQRAFYNVESVGYGERVHLAQHFASEIGAHWIEGAWGPGGGRKVGLLFVDDDHSYADAKAAIEAWAPHLADGAVIAVDDYGHPDWPGVAQAVDELVDSGFLAPIQLFHDRLAVTRLGSRVNEPGKITAITSEGVQTQPKSTELPQRDASEPLANLSLAQLRALGRARNIPRAGAMGEEKLRALLAETPAP